MENSNRSDGTAAARAEPVEVSNADRETEPAMLYCPVCNERLVSSRCKLVCQRCGYFMSCADYY